MGSFLAGGCAENPSTGPSKLATNASQVRRSKLPSRPQRPVNPYGFNQVLKYESIRVDFGEVSGQELTAKAVPFQNLGKETVEISSVSTTCPCAMAFVEKRKLSPGEQGRVEIFVDPSKTSENFRALVSIAYKNHQNIDRIEITGKTVRSSRGEQ